MKTNLLICIKPLIETRMINELTFYQLINPITPVLNVKIISWESQVKAFVQVNDEDAAIIVSGSFHKKKLTIGQISVFLSHKKFISYEKSLSQIYKELVESNKSDNDLEIEPKNIKLHDNSLEVYDDKAQVQFDINKIKTNWGYSPNENDYEKNMFATFGHKQNNTKLKENNKYNSKVKNIMKTIVNYSPRMMVSITHKDPVFLRSKLLMYYFSRFGVIVKKILCPDNPVWTIVYESEEAAQQAKDELTKTSFMGYEVFNANTITNNNHNNHCIMNQEELNSHRTEPYTKGKLINLTKNDESCNIRVNPMQYLNNEILCRIVANKHIPLRICEAFDVQNNSFFFILTFSRPEEARNVCTFLNAHTSFAEKLDAYYVDLEFL